MKKIVLFFIFGWLTTAVMAQPTGYYNGTEGLAGDDLRNVLHELINEHQGFLYVGGAEAIVKHSDEDPDNPSNVLLVYSGASIPKSDFGDVWNREHVWAKSHGDFGTEVPTGADVHNLKPVDADVNSLRSYKDFDIGGDPVPGAPGCFTDGDSWEPRDEVKGDIARIIFYMDVRYEGTNGEIDLLAVDEVNTFPNPQHGKLSTLLQWHLDDPPSDFERRRNQRIFGWQHNRNPFIDHPEFVGMLWQSLPANPVAIGGISQSPEEVFTSTSDVTISATITSDAGINDAVLKWGTSFDNLSNEATMTASGNVYSADISGVTEGRVFYAIEATDGTSTNILRGDFMVWGVYNGSLTSIYDIQGQTSASPYDGQEVTTSGVVTGNIGTHYYLQDGTGEWNGVFVYDSGRNPQVGDSIVITGLVDEYYDLTEIKEVSEYYHCSSDNELPEPAVIQTGDVAQEKYEGVLVRVENAVCTNADIGYGMWKVDDGSGEAIVHNTYIYTADPEVGDIFTITGPLNYDFSEFKIDIRSEEDAMFVPDSEAPVVDEISTPDNTTVQVVFNETLNMSTALEAGNYTIDNGITVNSVSQIGFLNDRVSLSVSELGNPTYTLTIDGVEDAAGNATDNYTVQFGLTGIEEVDNQLFTIYPNPVSGSSFTISMKETPRSVKILNTEGKVVAENNQLGSNEIAMPAPEVSGVYFIEITLQNGQKTTRRIVVK